MSPDPAAVVDRYLAVVADLHAEPDALAVLLHPDARFVEHPNLVAPSGRRRDAAAARAAFEHGRALLAGTASTCTSTSSPASGSSRARRGPARLPDRRRRDPRRDRDAGRVLHGLHRPRRADPRPGELRLLPARRGGLTRAPSTRTSPAARTSSSSPSSTATSTSSSAGAKLKLVRGRALTARQRTMRTVPASPSTSTRSPSLDRRRRSAGADDRRDPVLASDDGRSG